MGRRRASFFVALAQIETDSGDTVSEESLVVVLPEGRSSRTPKSRATTTSETVFAMLVELIVA